MKKPVHIHGKLWFQKTYGNTYHSVTITYDDGSSDYIPFTYGYDDQYLQTAISCLQAMGIVKDTGRIGTTRYVREVLNCGYTQTHVTRKKDL